MDMADVLFHLHPDLSQQERSKVEENLRGCNGVLSVHFSREHHHSLKVAYDPETVHSDALLKRVRDIDARASMIGL